MGTKTIILVRHGQYHPKSETRLERLTSLGRKQAKHAGRRLKENAKVDRIIHSTMPRAMETAGIIREELGHRGKVLSCVDLCECVPGFPKELRKKFGFTDEKKLKKDQAVLDRAFKKYFNPSTKDSLEIIVCHGNVIRYFVCKVMGVDTLKWRNMDIQQCGISIVEIKLKDKKRRDILISHNDVGHIPKAQRTFI